MMPSAVLLTWAANTTILERFRHLRNLESETVQWELFGHTQCLSTEAKASKS